MRRFVQTLKRFEHTVPAISRLNYQPIRFFHFTTSFYQSNATEMTVSSPASSAGFIVEESEGGASGYSEIDEENDEEEYEQSEIDEYEEWEDPLHPTQFRERKVDKYGQAHGVGRRKTAVARVWIKPGVGQVKVNHRDVAEYFQNAARSHALEAFQVTSTAGLFDAWCLVHGGGFMGKKFFSLILLLIHSPIYSSLGQAGAVRLGLARAIEAYEPGLKPFLKRGDHSLFFFSSCHFLICRPL
jgi:ribosomal protein S9